MAIEVALFKVRQGVLDERVIAVSDMIQQEVAQFEGYLGRQLCKAEGGEWVDIVRWTSAEAAQRAFTVIETKPCMRAFGEIEEPGSSHVLLAHPVKAYPGTAGAVPDRSAADPHEVLAAPAPA